MTDAPSPDAAPPRARCYACARRQDPRAPECGACGATFLGLCLCGAHHSVYALRCPACDARLQPRRLPRWKHPWVRAARRGLVVAGVGTAAWLGWRRMQEPPAWRQKEAGRAAYQTGDLEGAAETFRRLTVRTPGDAQVWYDLSLTLRRMGRDRSEALRAARRAAELAPAMLDARLLLALAEGDAGDAGRALEQARAACDLPGAGREARLLLARSLLAADPADLGGAAAVLEAALRDAPTDADARAVLAECLLEIHGDLRPDAYPADVAAGLVRGREAMVELAATDTTLPRDLVAVLRARLALATGQPEAAVDLATSALSEAIVPEEVSLAALRALRARGLLRWRGMHDAVASDAAAALDARTGGAAARMLGATLGADEPFREVLARFERVATADGSGAARREAARALLRLGRGAEAADLLAKERGLLASDPDASVVHGDALAATGDVAGARLAYARAAAAGGDGTAAFVGTVLLPLVERNAPAPDALASVRERLLARPRDARLLAAAARLELAAGDAEAALPHARAALAASPSDPDGWRLLAEVHRVRPDPGAAAAAARAWGRARRLRPTDADLAVEEARALLDSGDAPGALASAGQSLTRDRDAPALLVARAEASMALGDWAAAAADLGTVRTLGAASTRLRILEADCLRRTGDRAGALRRLDEAAAEMEPSPARLLAPLRALCEGESPDALVLRLGDRGERTATAAMQLLTGQRVTGGTESRAAFDAAKDDPAAWALLLVAAVTEHASRDDFLEWVSASVFRDLAPGADPASRLARGAMLVAGGDPQAGHDALRALGTPAAAPCRALLGVAAYDAGHVAEGLRLLRSAAADAHAGPGSGRVLRIRLLRQAASAPTEEVRTAFEQEARRWTSPAGPAATEPADGATTVRALFGGGMTPEEAAVAAALLFVPGDDASAGPARTLWAPVASLARTTVLGPTSGAPTLFLGPRAAAGVQQAARAIRFEAISTPEPGSIALWLLGAAALGTRAGRGRKRRRAAR